MKGFFLWAGFGVFLYLAITAVSMGEFAIAAGLGLLSFACLVAAPSGGGKKATKSKRRKESARR